MTDLNPVVVLKTPKNGGIGVPRVVLNPCRNGRRPHGFRRRNPWHPTPTFLESTHHYEDSISSGPLPTHDLCPALRGQVSARQAEDRVGDCENNNNNST